MQLHDLEQAWRDLFAGRTREAAAAFQQGTAETGASQAAAGLFLCAAIVGAKDAAFELLKQRTAHQQDAGLVLWQATWIAARNGAVQLLQILEVLFNHLPEDAPERAPLYYAAGHLAARTGDNPAAIAAFLKARAAFLANPGLFLTCGDETLTTVFVQCSHLLAEADMGDLARRAVGRAPNRTPGGPPLVAVAADGRYLRRFGPGFVQSLRERAGARCQELLILAVDSRDADVQPLCDPSPGLTVHCRHDVSDGWPVRPSALYASWRFLEAAGCLDTYNRPLLFLDIDVEIQTDLSPLLDMAADHDFCCYVRPDGGPGGIARAAAVSFRPGQGTRAAALAGAYLRKRFSEEAEDLWFADQVALWRSAAYLEAQEPSFRWGDFTDAGPLDRFFDLKEDPETKRR